MLRIASVLAGVAALAAPAGAVAAPTTTTTTTHLNGVVESDVVNDCAGDPAHIWDETFVFDMVEHTTTLADGTSHFTVTAHGTDTLVPRDPNDPTYSGPFAFWDGDNTTRSGDEGTFTQAEVLFGSDGSRLRFTIVVHASPNGVSFAHAQCVQT